MGSEIRVLVVDDEIAVRRLMVRALAPQGYVITEAPDGATALALLEEHEFDVILLDQGLPDVAGTEVLRRLRTARPTATTPVLLVTGRGSVSERVEGLGAGANDYLVKPVDLDELVARVEAQVRGRDAWRTEVADALSERAALASSLASIDEQVPTAAAASVASHVVRLPAIGRVAVVDVTPNAPLVLADVGNGTTGAPGGRHLHPSAAAELRQSVAARDGPLSPLTAERVVPGATGPVTALGVEDGGDLVGALVVELGPDADSTRRRPDAAVLDLLPVIDRVLGPVIAAGRALGVEAADLRTVIDSRAFAPVFQPIFDLASHEVVGYEALTRFDDGSAPERRFVQAARAGVGPELELATLEVAVRDAARLPNDHYVSYNVSAAVLLGGDLPAVLPGAGGVGFVLEITEHERIDDYAAVRDSVRALGEHVRLSVDDAGSGWASLRHVLSLRPDFVKLDRGWIHELDRDPARQALLLGIARFVEEMGGRVVAEGIETESELAQLRRLGIHAGQGFLLARPVPVSALSRA